MKRISVLIANKINYQLERLIPITTPLGILLGFLLPNVFIHIRPFVIFLFSFMTLAGAIKLKAHEMGEVLKRPFPIFLFFISAHIIVPVIALFSSSIVFSEKDLITGFVLLFAGPAAVSSFIWVIIYNGNKALGLSLILIDTILAPIVVPLTLFLLLGEAVTMDMRGIAVSLLFMVVIPTIIGVVINEISKGKAPQIISVYLDPFSKICLFIVIAANVSPISGKINLLDTYVWKTAFLCILLIIIGFSLIIGFSKLFKIKGGKKVSLMFATGLKNNSAIMTLAIIFFPEITVLPVIMSLLFQQTIAAITGKILKKRDLKNQIPELKQNH